MNKVIEVLIAGFLFCVIIFYLIPMLPTAGLRGFVLMVIVVAAIIYILTLISGYTFPWDKRIIK